MDTVVGPPALSLSERQAAIFHYLVQYVGTHGYPPTLREIGAHMRIKSPSGVNDHLAALERKGYIQRGLRMSRAITILRPATEVAHAS